jgi:hypothetical protein
MKKQRSFEEKFDRKARVAQRHDFQERKQRENKKFFLEEFKDKESKRSYSNRYANDE